MPRLFLEEPRNRAVLPWASFAADLGADTLGSSAAPSDGAQVLAFLDKGSPARAGDLPVTYLVPPETPLDWMNPFVDEFRSGRLRRLVLHTPMHYLYALERLRLPANKLELIPWAVDVTESATPQREEGLIVELQFDGSEQNLAERSGLARSGRIECSAPGDVAARVHLLARAAVVMIAAAATESGAGNRELLLAMALGTPIVATRTWGLEHLLVPDVEGVLVPAGDLPALRREVERLLGQTEEALAMGERAAAKHRTLLSTAHYLARIRRIVSHADDDPSPEFYLIAAHSHTSAWTQP